MDSGAPEMGSCPVASISGDPPSDTPRAPRHGLNAKALLMQAAALAAEDAANMEETSPGTLSDQEKQIAQLKSAFTSSSKLLTGVPKRETPVVAFVNHTKVSQSFSICASGKIGVCQDHANHTDQVGIVQCRYLESHGSRCCKNWRVNIWQWLLLMQSKT